MIPKYQEDPSKDPEFERNLHYADSVMSEAMRALFLNKSELSTVNKKILYGILSKKPEKHLMKLAMSNASAINDGGRTQANFPAYSNIRTPIFYDLSQSSVTA